MPGGVFPILLLPAQGQYSGVFSHLSSASRGGSDRRAALFALEVIFGALQHVFCFHNAVVGVLIGAGGLGDGYSVARFEQSERHARRSLSRRQLIRVNVDGVFGAFQNVELGVNRLLEALGFRTDLVFCNDFVTRVSDGEVRFRGHDQAESLQIGGDANLVLAIFPRQDFAQVYGPPFGCNRPQYVCQILAAELAGRVDVTEIHVNGESACLPINFRVSGNCGHEGGAPEVDRGGTAAMTVVDCSRGSRIDAYAENRHLGVVQSRRIGLRLCVRRIAGRRIERGSWVLLRPCCDGQK